MSRVAVGVLSSQAVGENLHDTPVHNDERFLKPSGVPQLDADLDLCSFKQLCVQSFLPRVEGTPFLPQNLSLEVLMGRPQLALLTCSFFRHFSSARSMSCDSPLVRQGLLAI